MPTTATAELYFIAGAFVLILLICTVTVYVFFRQLRRERPGGNKTDSAASVRDPDGGGEEE